MFRCAFRRMLGLALLLAASCGSPAAAVEAPGSLAGFIMREVHYTFGVSPWVDAVSLFNADGSYTGLYFKLSFRPIPAAPRDGTYTYTKTGPDTATLVRTTPGGLTETRTMTFTTPTTGELVGANGYDGGPFVLSHPSQPPVLVNTSQRAWVAPGRPGIVGFVVPAGRVSLCLIRAVGPGLGIFPGTTPAADARLEVYRAGDLIGSDLIATNDDWERDPVFGADAEFVAATTTMINYTGAFPLAAGSKDAAFVLLLSSGNYTVHMLVPEGAPEAEILGEVYVVP
jgi:hypothetical protein